MHEPSEFSPNQHSDTGAVSDEETGANDYFAKQMDTNNLSYAVNAPGDTTDDYVARDQENDNSPSSKHDDGDAASRATSVGFVEYTGEDASPASQSKDTAPGSTSKPENDNGAAGPPHGDKPCPAESTLWMNEIKENWDHDFLTKAFEKFKFKPKHIKIINEKTKTKMYAFIEFDSPEIAKAVLLKCSERSVPGDPERTKFHLSFANLPNQIINEYCLSVGNLSSSVTDIDLFKLFGTKYSSCRGAKVHVNPDGRSKGIGIIKFSNQTDQQLALVEMHKQTFKGKEIILRLAPTKQRGPKNLINTMQQQQAAFGGVSGMYGQPPPGFGGPMYGGTVPFGNNNRTFGNQFGGMGFSGFNGSGDRTSYLGPDGIFRSGSQDHTGYDRERDRRRKSRSRSCERSSRDTRNRDSRSRRGRSPSSRRRRRSRSPDRKRKCRSIDDHVDDERKKLLQPAIFFPSYIEDNEPVSAAAHNELLIDVYEDYLTSLESGKWSEFVIASNWQRDDIIKHLYSETLVADDFDEK